MTCRDGGVVERSSALLNAVQRRCERPAAPNLLPLRTVHASVHSGRGRWHAGGDKVDLGAVHPAVCYSPSARHGSATRRLTRYARARMVRTGLTPPLVTCSDASTMCRLSCPQTRPHASVTEVAG